MARTFHKGANNIIVVKDKGMIVDNFPAPKSIPTYDMPSVGDLRYTVAEESVVNLDEVIARYQETQIEDLIVDENSVTSFTCKECGTENSNTKVIVYRSGRYETLCASCGTDNGWHASEYDQDIPNAEAIRTLTDSITLVDEKIAALQTLNADEYVRVGDLGLTEAHIWDEDSIISKKDAIDLARLEKATFREARTVALLEAEAALGIERMKEYGEGNLGSSIAVGTHEPNTLPWLLARAEGVGGSDKIGYLNENNEFIPYDGRHLRPMLASKSRMAIEKIKKTARTEPLAEGEVDDASLPIKIGNALERTIQYEFAVTHPEYTHYQDKSSRVAEGRPHHRFNPDGVLQDNKTGKYGIFEAKTSRNAETFEKAVPGYKAQCLHNAAAAGLNFAVLVADVEGETQQRVLRLDFTDKELADYRARLDHIWFTAKPEFERSMGKFR